ncbi:B-cell receptor CD22-like isoform X2 [Osmerus eperlanus]|uniref:B-cell receptor CD22-like isoform X2 n=1 Tax=Osmerus eperlanus TaxID=29151 RepID=UPI002E112304
MCIGHAQRHWSLALLFLSGVVCTLPGWNVEYQPEPIYAVKGCSVVIPCLFSYPVNQVVKRVMWGHNVSDPSKKSIYDSVRKHPTKFVYLGNRVNNCSFQINQLEHRDSGIYKFRFKTDKNQWTGVVGSTLKVVDLISVTTSRNGTIIEGDFVNMTCKNIYDGPHRSSIEWSKNGVPFYNGSTLYINNISLQNSGSYACMLNYNSRRTLSEVFRVNVEYGPKNTSVSISPCSEVEKGSNVTLTCSSEANPPVQRYAWFLIDGSVHHKLTSHFELYFWDVQSYSSGQYYCVVNNKHGSQNSSIVTLEVKDEELKLIWIIITYMLLTVTLLMIIVYMKRRMILSTTPDKEETTERYMHAECPVEESEEDPNQIIYTTVYMTTKPQTLLHSEEHPTIYSPVEQLNFSLSPAEDPSEEQRTCESVSIYDAVFSGQ